MAPDANAGEQLSFKQKLSEVQTSFAALHERIASLEDGYMQDLETAISQRIRENGKVKKLRKKKRKESSVAQVCPTLPEPEEDIEAEATDTASYIGEEGMALGDEKREARCTFKLDEALEVPRSKSTRSRQNTLGPVASFRMRTIRATGMSGPLDPVMAAATNNEEELGKRLLVAKNKLNSCRDHSILQKVANFLRTAMGKHQDAGQPSEIRWLIFEFFAACMIAANSLALGVEVQYSSQNSANSAVLMGFSLFFANWFILEVIIRMRVVGIGPFFCDDDRVWNLFDLALAFVSVFELSMVVFGSNAKSSFSSIKAIKILRMVRLFRVFRFFRQLATLALMVADSVRQLLWALVMFLLIMYVFAITLTSSCSDWLKERVDFEADWQEQVGNSTELGVKEVHHFFGSLPRSVYTLFQTTLGGISWYEVTDALAHVDSMSFALMFAYIIFTILALMNVFTGVFVDNAVQNSKKQRKIQIDEALDKKRTMLDQMIEFFVATDLDGDGTISLEEIQVLLEDPVMSAYFDMIGFRPSDAKMLAQLLDRDGSGEVTLTEFIAGCDRMRGEAKGVDVHLLLLECYQISERIERLEKALPGSPPPTPTRQSRLSHYLQRLSSFR
ncbi:unnamed protein product [Effrenium voratum]|uniref:EF-hand domain-containing protein n=1 Tax=Effrenium voratum TaxID=2562239 RepID=A0AA36J9Y3_9DINO|nr:unnamed protein product [Effrenium voratum]CAJ1414139.1 unnamed protein product [Effrenium voratum]